MKDLITTIGSIIILMMFLLQFAANQTTYTRIMGAEHEIKEFRLLSQETGSINNEDINSLKSNLSKILHCLPSEISVKVTGYGADGENEESRPADYSVTMPIYGVIGPAGMMGLSEDENVKQYTTGGIIVFNSKESDDGNEPDNPEEE